MLVKNNEINTFILFISACVTLEKLYTLDEGIRFLHKYKDRKTGFVKAVKDLYLISRWQSFYSRSDTSANKNCYMKLSMHTPRINLLQISKVSIR